MVLWFIWRGGQLGGGEILKIFLGIFEVSALYIYEDGGKTSVSGPVV